MKKKIISLVLAAIMLISLSPRAAADSNSRVVVGADLSEEQIAQVYELFGVERGSVAELRMTNAEERAYLQGIVSEEQLGSYSISCVYFKLLPEGSGLKVSCRNVTWCTEEMYVNALATAGITDAEIIVAAPFEVSGTAALAGIYKAYEDISGVSLDSEQMDAGSKELAVTGGLADEIGSSDAAGIVDEVKGKLNDTASMSDEELHDEIAEVASRYGVTLTEYQIGQIAELCRAYEKIDVDAMIERVEKAKETMEQISEAKEKTVSFFQWLRNAYIAVRDFFKSLSE